MAPHSEFRTGTVPEMYLYNSDSTHFDLLVENNSRLAVLGFISVGKEKEVDMREGRETKASPDPQDNQGAKKGSEEQWQTIFPSKQSKNQVENSCNACKKLFFF